MPEKGSSPVRRSPRRKVGMDFFAGFLRRFESAEVGCPFVLPKVETVADSTGAGWSFAVQLGRGVVVGELEWTGNYDGEREFKGDEKRVWVALLFSGECNLTALGEAEFFRVEAGRCAVLCAERVVLQWRGDSKIRALVYSLSDEAWTNWVTGGELQKSPHGRPSIAPHKEILRQPLGTRLSFLTKRIATQSPLDRLNHMHRMANYHDWLAGFFSRFLPSGEGPRLSRSAEVRIREAASFLETNPGEPHSLSSLCRQFHLNEFALKQGFRAIYGTTVFGFLRSARLRAAEEMLKEDKLSVLEIATALGFANPSHFSKCFKEHAGCLPSAFRSMWRAGKQD